MTMLCSLRDKWVTALRSGKYRQGYHSLQHNGAFCCLGVLCEVAGVEKGPTIFGFTTYRVPSLFGDEFTSKVVPAEIAGLDEIWCQRLASMNDDGISFEKIADKIDKDVPCLPVEQPE